MNWPGIKNVLAFVGAVFIVLTLLMMLGLVDGEGWLYCPEGQEMVYDDGAYGPVEHCEVVQ